MIKSIVSGGAMLVAALGFLLGITDLVNMTSAALVSWGALFAVAFILFAAFGGFKPFFSPLGHDAAQLNEQSGLANLAGQDQAISRRLVTVGGEEEVEGAPLFGDRSPIVSQPEPSDSPLFGDAVGRIGSPESPTKPPGFGDALGERLAGDRDEHNISEGPASEVAGEVASPRDAVADVDLSPPLVTEAAPWVAARNEALLEHSPAPHIEVEESPSWMRPSDGETAPESEAGVELTQTTSDEIEFDEASLDSEMESAGEIEVDGDIADEIAEEITEEEPVQDLYGSDTESDADSDVESEDTRSLEIDRVDDDDSADVDDSAEEIAAEDEDSAEEIAAEEIAVVTADTHDRTDELVTAGAVIAEENGSAQLPVVVKPQAPLEIHKYSPSEIMAVVRTQESELVDTLIDEGVLTTSGPITDRDVRTMLFVAVSSNELIDVLTAASGNGDPASGNGDPANGTAELNS